MDSAASPPRRPRALILETEAQAGSAMAAALAGCGFLVERCERPGAASARVRIAEQEGAPYELLVVPAQCAGLDGLEVATLLAQRSAVRPGILLTSGPYSAPTTEALNRCGAAAAVALVPLRADQLRGALAAVVPAQRLMDAARASGSGLLAI